ncbi:MAG: ESPR domain-containing protein, partial [Neisseriaceae bacterium]|nr:ESPR domain-containing protein [Neisseriaceae bacterium]
MNKIYRTVYNETTGTWVAVCETAKTHTKSSGKSSVVKAVAAAGLMAVAGVSVAATTSTGNVAQQASASHPTAKVETEGKDGTKQGNTITVTGDNVDIPADFAANGIG